MFRVLLCTWLHECWGYPLLWVRPMARMKVFNTLEEEAFEPPPVFNSAERKQFFSLPVMFKDSMVDLRTPTNKVCFLVAAGYFKARRRFFGRQFRQTDIEYAAHQVGVNQADVRVDAFSKETCSRHQRVILNYFGCSPFNKAAKIITASEIAVLSQSFQKSWTPAFPSSTMLPTSRRFQLNYVQRYPVLPAAPFGAYELSQCRSM